MTVTVPLLAAPPALCTVIAYVAPLCPAVKVPACVFVRVRSGPVLPVLIVVTSLAVLLLGLTSPPPDTLAVFVSVGGGLAAMSTVSVSGG